MDIFSFQDYRLFLQAKYAELKEIEPKINYRTMAEQVGFKSAGFFTNIIKGKRNISMEMAKQFGQFFKLKIREQQYFDLLVLGNQAKKPSLTKFYLDKAQQLKNLKLKAREIGSHVFYNKWYYSVVRELIEVYPFKGDYKELAKMVYPSIREREAEEAIRKLLELKMIKKNPDSTYSQTDAIISSGTEITSATLAKFHEETSDLAKHSIENKKPGERNISTLTLGITDDGYHEIVQKLRSFRKEILEIAKREKTPDQVYHMNFHLFPMSKKR